MENIERLLADKRNCRSQNMQKFFKKLRNRRYDKVIRHMDILWFADYWQEDNGRSEWVGVRVASVASFAAQAHTGWMVSQLTHGYEDVSEWFWSNYFDKGMYGIYEVWHRKVPKQLTHAEMHTF